MDVTLGLSDAGIIHTQLFLEGDVIKKGDVILELDKNLETLEVSRRKAVMDQNKMVYDSTLALSQNTKSVSKEDLEKSAAQYNVSAAEYSIAVQQLADRQLVAPFSGTIAEVLLRPGRGGSRPINRSCALWTPRAAISSATPMAFPAANLHLDEPVKIQLVNGQTATGEN